MPLSASPPEGLEALAPEDRLLAAKAEQAIRDGAQLERWLRLRHRAGALKLFPLSLGRSYRLPNRAEAFFDALEIGGTPTPVMGSVQTVEFGPVERPAAAERVREFVFAQFLNRAHWTYADGAPGGFTIEQGLFKTVGGEYGRFTSERARGCVDWRTMGTEYAWVVLTVNIHDFVMEVGRFKMRLREAACVAPSPEFVHVEEDPTPEYALEVAIGYPFLAVAPIPNVFGFGPGKFGTAVKLYSFLLTRDRRLRARLIFASAPRCQKVFDFGGRWPDPVYGGARLLSRLTLGRWNAEPFHDRLDAGMLAQHCRVHQALMDGVHAAWKEWDSTAHA